MDHEIMTFILGKHSLQHLEGVHPDLVAVVHNAIARSTIDFAVLAGLRTPAIEADMVAKGASTTMHSRHLPNKQGLACAVDVMAMINGQGKWEPVSLYAAINDAMQAAAHDLNVPVEWGGDWHTFKDYGHFQLPWAKYP